MKYRQLGKKGPKVSSLGLGCMVLSAGHYGDADEKMGLQVLREAYEQGITFFDTADMYSKGENEKLVGKGIKPFGIKSSLQPNVLLYTSQMALKSTINLNISNLHAKAV